VRIDGDGRFDYGFEISSSPVSLRGLTFTNQARTGVVAIERSRVNVLACNFDGRRGLEIENYCHGFCVGCVFRSPGNPGGTAVDLNGFSLWTFGSGVVPIDNSITGYETGIFIRTGSLVGGSPLFSGNDQNVVTACGGLHVCP
jgi:hypothetical protein